MEVTKAIYDDLIFIEARAEPSIPCSVVPVAAAANSQSQSVPESSASPAFPMKFRKPIIQSLELLKSLPQRNNSSNLSGIDDPSSANNASAQDKEEAAKDVPIYIAEKFINISSEEKAVNQEPLTYADKLHCLHS
ncbi:uncharacterized protein [Euphorbia lathyris]|uniref:uncharacterized protein isoform X2 n=1 Tax=Euphorbia lathyris TaxID=212925 RepID=UPI003313F8E8